jgi:hypothetical protein
MPYTGPLHKNILAIRAAQPLSRRLWKVLLFAAKIAVSILTLWYLYRHVWLDADFRRSLVLLKGAISGIKAVTILSTTVLLIGFNWGFEAMKWKVLVGKFHRVSFATSCKAVLAGMSVSLWIPNRTGEYLGRVLYVPANLRLKGILATLVGSLAQLIVTLIMGSLGLMYYALFNLQNYYLFTGICLLSVVLGTVLIFLYFHIQKVRGFIPNYHWLAPARKYARLYKLYSSAELGAVLNYSLLRYFVFCSQFLLLAWLFGAPLSLIPGFCSLFLIYLIQTAVPTTALSELGVRGVTTAFFFKLYTANIAGVLAASYTLWFINLALPGLFGLVFLFLARLKKNQG